MSRRRSSTTSADHLAVFARPTRSEPVVRRLPRLDGSGVVTHENRGIGRTSCDIAVLPGASPA